MDWFDGQLRQPVSRRINASVFYDSTVNWLKYIRGSASGAVFCQAARAREQNRQEPERHHIGEVHELPTRASVEGRQRFPVGSLMAGVGVVVVCGRSVFKGFVAGGRRRVGGGGREHGGTTQFDPYQQKV
jgi:hypothetical protein